MSTPTANYSRILAFLLSDSTPDSPGHVRALQHLQKLADGFGCSLHTVTGRRVRLILCYAGDWRELVHLVGDSVSACIGPVAGQPDSGHNHETVARAPSCIRDRFLHVTVNERNVVFTSDYAGSIPCFYSLRTPFSVSNVEPLVVLDSGATLDDIDIFGVYALLRYSHLIYKRTLFKHVQMMEPDSRLSWSVDAADLFRSPPKQLHLNTVRPSASRLGLTDAQVAGETYDLNKHLVSRALLPWRHVLLPLSSGYDSRMILLAAAEQPLLRSALCAATYGPPGSIEVQAARQLCQVSGVGWRHVNLPLRFLEEEKLTKIGLVFGSALHFHGMYQLEFAECIQTELSDAVITSGFMTGVPAGQHLSLLGIDKTGTRLSDAMNRFSQSKAWTSAELSRLSPRFTADLDESVEKEFQASIARVDGSPQQKSVMLDIWTRQRNWISYHPRTLEWYAPFISPHMCSEYVNFFLSLSERHLRDRRAIELMLRHFYPGTAHIPSNSRGLRSLRGNYNLGRKMAAGLSRIGLRKLVPARFLDEPLHFDIPALCRSGRRGVWPVFDLSGDSADFLRSLVSEVVVTGLFERAVQGSVKDYQRLVSIQAIAYGIRMVAR